MLLVNGEISLDQFNAGYVYNNTRLCDFFMKHAATRCEDLKVGAVFWKCTSFELRMPYTPWWLPKSFYDAALARCRSLGVSLRQYTRARLAVAYDFNERQKMDHLLLIQVMKPVRSFIGEARGVSVQHDSVDDLNRGIMAHKVALIGGDEQYCIPNLRPEFVHVLSWTSADDIPERSRRVGA